MYGTNYEDELKAVQGYAASEEAQHPIASTAGSIAGSVTALGPLAAKARGAQIMGLTGGGLISKIGRGAAFNAALEALDAQTRPDPAAASGNIPIAAAIGGAIPLAGRVAGPIVRSLVRGAGAGIGAELGEGLDRAGVEATDSALPPTDQPGAPPGGADSPPPPPPPGGGAAGGGALPPSGDSGAAMVRALSPDARSALQDAADRGGITAANVDTLNGNAHPEQFLGELTPGMSQEMGGVAAPTGPAKNIIEQA